MLKKNVLLSIALLCTIPLLGQFKTPADQLEKHVYILASDSLLGRGFGTEQGVKAARYIAEQYKEAGIEPLDGAYLHPFIHRSGILNISGINVAGVIPGSDPSLMDEYIVLGAHFDHLGWKMMDGDTVVYHGADDNASGTASIIEIGRNLAASKETLGRSVIIVAFDGEESGLIGSNRFLKDSIVSPDKIKLMFSLDMVGMYDAHGGLDMAGVRLLNDADAIVDVLAGKYNITIKKANASIGQRTDTAPFGAIGIPAIHTYTGLESPYHKPEDVATELDYQGMAQVSNFLSAATQQLSNVESLSQMEGPQEGQAELGGTRVFNLGLVAGMGSGHHKYKSEFYDGKSILSAEAGVFANIKVASMLTIQPEILYETKGSQHEDGNFRTHSITTPLNLLLTSPDNDMVQTYFMIGGYYSYHFGGSLGGVDMDFENEFTNQEMGIGYGFGMIVMNKVQIGINLRKGLSGILQDSGAGTINSDGFSATIGIIF